MLEDVTEFHFNIIKVHHLQIFVLKLIIIRDGLKFFFYQSKVKNKKCYLYSNKI